MNQSQYVNLNWILIQTNYRQSMFCAVGSNFSYHSIINSELLHKVQTSPLAFQSTNHYINNRFAPCSATNYIIFFTVCGWLVTVQLLLSTLTKCGRCASVASLSLSDKPTYFTKLENQKRQLANKDENAAEAKSYNAGNEIQSSYRRKPTEDMLTLQPFKRLQIRSQKNLVKANLGT